MISGPYATSTPDEPVLDLCVRKTEKRCASPVPDTAYSATVSFLQHRFYEDRRSPSISSEHGRSQDSISPNSPPQYSNPALLSATPILPRALGKSATRPFKAYPKDPLALINSPPDPVTGDSNEAYVEFRKRMLEQVHTINSSGHKNMRRPVPSSSPTQQPSSSSFDSKDSAYWERRRKNNEAAKRSRDARRAKEDEIAIRAAFLEQENVKLKYELAALRNETNRLRFMLFSN